MSFVKLLHSVKSQITLKDRARLLCQTPRLIWFTGLSGAGKSTLAVQLEIELFQLGYKVFLLDGDNIRLGINSDLGFSEKARSENIRRVAEVTKLFLDAGIVVLAAFISPFRTNREIVRKIVGSENYFEVFVDAPLEVCEQRDVKGLYKMARSGQLQNFTGIDSPYERPSNPSIQIRTDQVTKDEAIQILLKAIEQEIRY
jgi:adenylylsulfate kinase